MWCLMCIHMWILIYIYTHLCIHRTPSRCLPGWVYWPSTRLARSPREVCIYIYGYIYIYTHTSVCIATPLLTLQNACFGRRQNGHAHRGKLPTPPAAARRQERRRGKKQWANLRHALALDTRPRHSWGVVAGEPEPWIRSFRLHQLLLADKSEDAVRSNGLVITRYGFTLKLYCGSQSSFYCPPPTWKAYPIAILLHGHCAIYAHSTDPPFYAIHHTILGMAISCKGQAMGQPKTRTSLRHTPKTLLGLTKGSFRLHQLLLANKSDDAVRKAMSRP